MLTTSETLEKEYDSTWKTGIKTDGLGKYWIVAAIGDSDCISISNKITG